MKCPRFLAWISLTFLTAAATDAADVSFNRDIRPILSENCYYCHGFDEAHREADLRLDTADGLLQAIEPGSPDDSELLRRVLSEDEDELMPPSDSHKTPLTADQADLIRRWILSGARYEPHWAFMAPQRPKVPVDADHPIDHFIGRKLRQQKLEWGSDAGAGQWLRRATLDLTGLPPTADEIQAFQIAMDADRQSARNDAVDRLLASPRYGERMAIEWLDVARYADTNGYQSDAYRTNWPWRDWVVGAFNANMPFDQFTIEQLAGDLLDDPSQSQLIATAFNRNHMINGEGGSIAEENRAKYAFDRVETTSTAFMGLTVGCSQCHDHKFDPIKQKDYYRLFAMFNQMDEPGGVNRTFGVKDSDGKYEKFYGIATPLIELGTDEDRAELRRLTKLAQKAEKQLADAQPEYEPAFVAWVEEMRQDPELIGERLSGDQEQRVVNNAPLDDLSDRKTKTLLRAFLAVDPRWKDLNQAALDARDAAKAYHVHVPLVMVMKNDKPRPTFVFERGSYQTPGEPVSAGVPGFLPPLPDGESANRLGMARWLVSADHPLTARVTVNRYWQLFFGRGLVDTPDDFGMQGALPSHPDLLDWLAVEFVESGWDVKHLVKTIVTSRAYGQTSTVSQWRVDADPDNRLISRGPRYRLDSRLIRDQALSLSGLLSPAIGGPPVMPYQPPGIWEEMSLGRNRYFQDSGDKLYRRSLYTLWRRVVGPTNFFDTPARQNCSVKPRRTSTPLHALTLLNDPTYVESARAWAERILVADQTDSVALQNAFFSATARNPDDAELNSLRESLREERAYFHDDLVAAENFLQIGASPINTDLDPAEHAAWASVCLLILNLDETISKP